jgi:hypothetical protein
MALTLALLLLRAVAAPAGAAEGAEQTQVDTLTIKVGYFGGPYYEKAVFTMDDLWNMDLVYDSYTFVDNMPAVGVAHVAGVTLADLMDAAGIDLNSIQSFHFQTLDGVGSQVPTSKRELIDTPRYSFPTLPENYDDEGGGANELAWQDPQPVQTVLALEEDWRRCIEGATYTGDGRAMDSSRRLRLVYGQTDPNERTASDSYYWIYEIVVVLGGAPVLTMDASVLEGEVGSVLRTQLGVSADSAVVENAAVTWSSSDESVATVDENGNITVRGEGTAVITASFAGVSTSVVVNGTPGDGNAGAGGTEEPGDPSQDASDSENTEAPGSDAQGPEGTQTPDAQPADVVPTDATRQLLTPVTLAQSDVGGVQNWRQEEMSDTATALPDIQADSSALALLGAAAGGLFLVSAAVYVLLFYRSVGRKRT